MRVFGGASGEFELVEDDGSGAAGQRQHRVRTPIRFDWDGGSLRVGPADGTADGVTRTRAWVIAIEGISRPGAVRVTVGGREVDAEFAVKGEVYALVASGASPAGVVAALAGLGLDEGLFGALVELILADAG